MPSSAKWLCLVECTELEGNNGQNLRRYLGVVLLQLVAACCSVKTDMAMKAVRTAENKPAYSFLSADAAIEKQL